MNYLHFLGRNVGGCCMTCLQVRLNRVAFGDIFSFVVALSIRCSHQSCAAPAINRRSPSPSTKFILFASFGFGPGGCMGFSSETTFDLIQIWLLFSVSI